MHINTFFHTDLEGDLDNTEDYVFKFDKKVIFQYFFFFIQLQLAGQTQFFCCQI
jgi:hypothetical protein